MREALSHWLDEHEQLAGFQEPQAQREQFQAACQSVAKRHDWVSIHRLRQLLPWPRERFNTVLEGLRTDHQVEWESAESNNLSPHVIQDSITCTVTSISGSVGIPNRRPFPSSLSTPSVSDWKEETLNYGAPAHPSLK